MTVEGGPATKYVREPECWRLGWLPKRQTLAGPKNPARPPLPSGLRWPLPAGSRLSPGRSSVAPQPPGGGDPAPGEPNRPTPSRISRPGAAEAVRKIRSSPGSHRWPWHDEVARRRSQRTVLTGRRRPASRFASKEASRGSSSGQWLARGGAVRNGNRRSRWRLGHAGNFFAWPRRKRPGAPAGPAEHSAGRRAVGRGHGAECPLDGANRHSRRGFQSGVGTESS